MAATLVSKSSVHNYINNKGLTDTSGVSSGERSENLAPIRVVITDPNYKTPDLKQSTNPLFRFSPQDANDKMAQALAEYGIDSSSKTPESKAIRNKLQIIFFNLPKNIDDMETRVHLAVLTHLDETIRALPHDGLDDMRIYEISEQLVANPTYYKSVMSQQITLGVVEERLKNAPLLVALKKVSLQLGEGETFKNISARKEMLGHLKAILNEPGYTLEQAARKAVQLYLIDHLIDEQVAKGIPSNDILPVVNKKYGASFFAADQLPPVPPTNQPVLPNQSDLVVAMTKAAQKKGVSIDQNTLSGANARFDIISLMRASLKETPNINLDLVAKQAVAAFLEKRHTAHLINARQG